MFDPNSLEAMVAALQGQQQPQGGSVPAQPPLQRMAGDLLPFPISPQAADMRRLNHEAQINDYANRMQRPASDIVGAMNQLYSPPGTVVPLPLPGVAK